LHDACDGYRLRRFAEGVLWINQIIPVGVRDQLLGRAIGTVMARFFLSLILLGIVGYIAQWGLLLTAVLILTATLASLQWRWSAS
jgi:hypothetical protein